MRQERRRHPRLEIPLEVALHLEPGEDETSATMLDLSAGGAGLLTTGELPVGTDIHRLHFDLPEAGGAEPRPIEVAARVARCEEQAGHGSESEFLVGVQFVDIERELFDRIQQFVFQRLRTSQKERVQIERPIAIRFDRFDDFVDEVSVNLSASGMFIRTRDPRPPGSVFNFQFQLGDDFSLIEGRAEVIWRRRHTEGPGKLAGMGVRFVNLDVPSQRLIDRLIKQKQEAEASGDDAAAAPGPSEAPDAPPPAGEATSDAPPELPAVEETAAEERTAPRTPPDLRHAEASILNLRDANSLRQAADQLRQQLDEAKHDHELQLQELRAGLEDRQAAASSALEERLRDSETARREAEQRRARLAEELDAARHETEELRRQLDSRPAEEEVERLTGERDELRAASDGLREELARARGEIDDLRLQLDSRPSPEEVERLTGERDELRAASDGLREELARAHGEAEELRSELDRRTPEDEVQGLGTERDALQATSHRLLAELDRANGEADELRCQIEERGRGEADLQGELESLRGEMEELERSHEQTLLRLESEHSAELEQATAAAEQQSADSLRQLDEAQSEQQRLEAEAEAQRRELEEQAEAAARQAADELEALRGEAAAARQRGDALDGELESLRRELEETRAASARELEAALASANAESERLRGDLAGAEESRQRVVDRLRQLREESSLAAQHAVEREAALRAEAENAALAVAGGVPSPGAPPRRSRGLLAGAALLLIGALLGTLALTLIEPLGSLAARLRPGGGEPVLAELPAAPDGSPGAPGPAATRADRGSPESGVTEPGVSEPGVSEPSTTEPGATGSGATRPGALGAPATAPDPTAAEEAVRAWAAAWSDQRVDDYLAAYDDSYQPPDGQSRSDWAAIRRERILRPKTIDVQIDAARTVELAADRVSVSFGQAYASDTYSDKVRKALVMVWRDGAWKIAEERVID